MNFLVVVPSLSNQGPVKGAMALIKILLKFNIDVELLVIKKTNNNKVELPDSVSVHYFHSMSFCKKLEFILMNRFDHLFTSCFSADILSLFIRSRRKSTSVRADNFQNYSSDYGFLGYSLALIHTLIFNFYSNIVVINPTLKNELKKFIFNDKKIYLIGNFIDEEKISIFKNVTKPSGKGNVNVYFLGNLISRKRVDLLIKFAEVRNDVTIHIVGDGPLRSELEFLVDDNKSNVIFHGSVAQPYDLISNFDVFVLPSLSEGVSRAMLESLYLGKPCLVRDVDSNSKIINNSNGIFFQDDNDFNDCLNKLIDNYLNDYYDLSKLLPKDYSFENAMTKYKKIITE